MTMWRTPVEANLNEWSYGIHRGEMMVKFLNEEIRPLKGLSVLDLGCNKAGISIALAEACESVVGSDISESSLKVANARIGEREIKNIRLVRLAAPLLPFRSESFDLVLLNGVLEWVPKIHQGNPKQIQIETLREVLRVLKGNGLLYLGIENRYFAKLFLGAKDHHTGLRLVTLLPRRFASLYSKILRRGEYRTYTHSFPELQSMIRKAGFGEITFYVPLPFYNTPKEVNQIGNGKAIREAAAQTIESKLERSVIRLITYLRLTRIFIHHFIVIARKP